MIPFPVGLFSAGESMSIGGYIGPHPLLSHSGPGAQNTTLDAANEAQINIGYIEWADGGSHTIDTSGSSSIQWRTASSTFANASTTFRVGIAPVDAATGPPGVASNSTDVISFDVYREMVGGGGGVTTSAWQTHVPTNGTKTIAHGDLAAVCMQMTARGGADSVTVTTASMAAVPLMTPNATSYTGGAYAATAQVPNVIIVASDGTIGWLNTGEVFSTISTRTWNSGSGQVEYGQLYQLPYSVSVKGIFGYVTPSADFDVVLYTDPLGTPSASRTRSIDANTISGATLRRFTAIFSSPVTIASNTPVAAIFKPGGSNISAPYKTLASATHRAADTLGMSGYGVSRASGAFADANSSLDHYYIGLILG
jgi:hypothetical protein